ncbi:MAG TPA: TonB-dependent receptor [Caulobacteraceae bacterium]|jgi:iron complex outermembrane receptor protein|nr:TonB-dependent receptor [Caulobacteraceae bacterium]
MTEHMLRLRRNLIATSCLVAATSLVPLAAHADDATATAAATATATADTTSASVAPIIVTAERREVNIQKAPISISSVGARQLDQSFVTSIEGLNGTIPSLEITKASGFENLVTIRGVGSETPENSLTTTPGVSEFVDGVYIANTISLDQTLFDIDSVQVLRGPQGALYGESSLGGAIILNTNQPKLGAFDASGDFSAGTYNLFRERGEVNLPLGDDFALRISAQKFDHDGFTNDVAIPGFRLDDAHDTSVKAALLWKPNDQFSATFTAQAYYANQNGDSQKNINDPESSPWSVYQDYPAHFQLNNDLFHLNLEWDEPNFVIKSVTGYQYLAHVQREDSSRSAFSLIGEYDDVAAWNTTVYNFNEEFDIQSKPGARFEWDAGAFYMDQRSHQYVAEFECTTNPFSGPCAPAPGVFQAPPSAADPLAPPSEAALTRLGAAEPSNLSYGNDSHAVHWSVAGFVQGTYHVADNFRITGGIRYNYDYDEDPSLNFSEFGQSFADNKAATSEPTWRLEADYDLTPDNLIYVSNARGYKPGGANGSYGQFVVPLTFQPETNTAFEIGSKNMFLDHTLRFNASLFYYIHKDFQYIETDPVPFDGGISNVPRVDDYGAEFEADYTSPDSKFNLSGNLSLEQGRVVGDYKTIDSTIANGLEGVNFSGSNEVDFTTFAPTGPCAFFAAFESTPISASNIACYNQVVASAVNIKGKQPPDMPNVSGSVSASYRIDTAVGVFTPRVQVVYRGSEWARIFDDPGLDKVPAYTVVNLNVDFVPTGNDHLRLSLAATNVGNEAGINSRYTDPYGTFMTSNQYIPPLQVIGTIAYRY